MYLLLIITILAVFLCVSIYKDYRRSNPKTTVKFKRKK